MVEHSSRPHGEPDKKHQQEFETCRIERWRGYVTSRFYVVTGDGKLFESEPFRWRHAEPPPPTRQARAAYQALVARLEAEGWVRLEEGWSWYATSFTRAATDPVDTAVVHRVRRMDGPTASAPLAREVAEEPEPEVTAKPETPRKPGSRPKQPRRRSPRTSANSRRRKPT